MKFTNLLVPFLIVFLPFSSFSQDIAIDHAPISIMGDHMHKAGEYMISLRTMKMKMSGNINKSGSLSDSQIINLPNPYQMGSMPAKLSVVPQNMDMNMTMLGFMYAPSDKFTLMAMAMFNGKEMTLNTYKGMMDRAYIGSFETLSSNKLSSFSLSTLIRLTNEENHNAHIEIGLSEYSGSNNLKGIVLTPMNMKKNMVLPYAMQQSDKSKKLIFAYTRNNKINENYHSGFQIRSISTIEKDKWSYGDRLIFSGWLQKQFDINTSGSLAVYFKNEGKINGRDSSIMAPVQTANPENYGGNTVEIGFGINKLLTIFPGLHKDRIAIEALIPINQQPNGTQMKRTWSLTFGYQKTF
ncbi:MAG: transporter [Pseudomonadota bacterium]|nr:transporter [Pseudomonadota bacterium]